MEGTTLPAQLKDLFQFFLNIILVIGLVILMSVWLIVVFFMLIYDAIFGGWNAKQT